MSKAPAWRWFWRDDSDAARFGGHPEEMTPDTKLVKANPVRGVFYRNGCYLKMEMPEARHFFSFWRYLLFPKARSEFHCAVALEEAGVPVTRALGYGWCLTNSMLITEEFPAGCSVTEYWCRNFVRDGKEPSAFLSRYAAFLRIVLESGFFHPDFHGGNILYASGGRTFALVDVYGVRRVRQLSRTQFLRMARIITELREVLDERALEKFAVACGLAVDDIEARELCSTLIERETRRIRHEMPRRLRQFFQDYPKFVRKVEYRGRTLRLTLDQSGTPWAEPDELNRDCYETIRGSADELRKLRQESFEKSMLLEKHARVVAYDESAGVLYRSVNDRPGH